MLPFCGMSAKERLMSLRLCTRHKLSVLWEKLNFSQQNDCWFCGNSQNNPQNFILLWYKHSQVTWIYFSTHI